MPHLHWNPLLRTWTMVAANRQQRPNRPAGWCPFCPGSGQVPNQYDLLVYPNDFPALSTQPEALPPGILPEPYRVAEAYGVCEVLLYSDKHDLSFCQLEQARIADLIRLWQARHRLHSADARIRYVYPFENRGEAVGVTLHHPHGQLYAYPFVPAKLEAEYHASRAHYAATGRALLDDILLAELALGTGLVTQNEHWVACIPHFTDYPYGVFVLPRGHWPTLPDLPEAAISDLAQVLKQVTTAFDALFNKPFPYMLVTHQAPCNAPEWADAPDWFRFHIEFYPPWRADGVVKYYASSEMGAGAAANTRNVADCAAELRALIG